MSLIHTNGSWHAYNLLAYDPFIPHWDMTHSYEWLMTRVQLIGVWPIHTPLRHDSFIRMGHVSRVKARVPIIHMCGMTHYVWYDSSICATWLIHMCNMTHSYVWHDSFICVTWLIMCDMTHPHVRHDWFTREAWLIYTCDVTYSHAWRDIFMCVTWLIHVPACGRRVRAQFSEMRALPYYTPVTWLIQICGVTQSNVWHDSFIE